MTMAPLNNEEVLSMQYPLNHEIIIKALNDMIVKINNIEMKLDSLDEEEYYTESDLVLQTKLLDEGDYQYFTKRELFNLVNELRMLLASK